MCDHDALPPPIWPSPASALEAQKHHDYQQFQRFDFDDSDEDEDEDEDDDAIPPPIPRSRSNSVNSGASEPPIRPSSHHGPRSPVNPLRAHPIDATATPDLAHTFAYPIRVLSEQPNPVPLVSQRRRSRGLNSYRTNKKLPPHLRRQPSLETIASVATTASEDYHDPPEAEAPAPDWFTQDSDARGVDPPDTHTLTHVASNAPSTKPPSSKALSSNASSGSSRQSDYTTLDHSPTHSLFRKMIPRRTEQSGSPTRLVIERNVSIDRTSIAAKPVSTASTSTHSLTQRRSPESPLIAMESASKSSSEWSASGFDTSGLSEAELKRCKKKGINPALFAEMRAAKKGKWTSPIAGNTFL